MLPLLTENQIASLAPGSALLDGRGLIAKKAFSHLQQSPDKTFIWAECKGSGQSKYGVAIDRVPSPPVMHCTCPSRQRPCKHGVGLLLLFSEAAESFEVADIPADHAEKRTGSEQSRKKDKKPRQINVAALGKKAEAQQEALKNLETFVTDLVSVGLGNLKAGSLATIQEQARRMSDADLQGARALLLRLAALVSTAEGSKGKKSAKKPAAPILSEEEHHTLVVSLVLQLWTMLRKGQQVLENKQEEGESQTESDAYVESILGRRWQLPELKESGYWVADRLLLELAHERTEDQVLEMVTASGYLLDLTDGSIYVERTILPVKIQRGAEAKHRISRDGLVQVKEAALYPGLVLNRRIRWDEKDAVMTERPREAGNYDRLHQLAKPLKPVLEAFRKQIANPIAPQEAVVLLAASKIGIWPDETVVIEDATGASLAFRDPRDAQYTTTWNLHYAGGAYGAGTLAVRLWYDLYERTIFGQALALIVGEKHLRLGL